MGLYSLALRQRVAANECDSGAFSWVSKMSGDQISQDENKKTPFWRRKHQLVGLVFGAGVGTAVGFSSTTPISGILVGIAITIAFGFGYPKATGK